MKALAGRVALITGASRGLGRAVALAFAREGADLTLCARGAAALEAVAAEARLAGARVLAVQADVRNPRDIERVVALSLERFDRIDILVNNASELGPTPLPYLVDSPPEAFVDVLQVNVVAPFRLGQSVIRSMLTRRDGIVINVSSDAAITGYPGWGAYSASKAALDSMTRTWAVELAGSGIRIHTVDPGDMDTAMHRAAVPEANPAELARPEDVAEAFVRLACVPHSDTRLEARSLLELPSHA
jgi:NAD(P)-dependent dehydrogenase (short-subunit alcohol dehydrogenase family)